MRKENSVIRTKFISEAGSQLVNADYFAFVELDNYACYCIADGIDNDKIKESAKLAVTTVIDEFYQRPGMSKGLIKGYLEKAHQVLLRESGTFRLEASVLVIITDYKKVRYGNAGNARLYHWRNGRIINQSKDQSLTQNLVERGDLALDKLEEHEERHNLYCYVGQRGKFRPYVSKKIKMFDGDILSLATCGIWENTGIAELLDAIEDAKGPEDVCTGMEDIVLSQRLRNIQNYTFVCIYVDKVYLNPNKQRNQKIVKKVVIPIAIVLVILLIVFIISKIMLYRKIDSMWHNIGLAVESMAEDMDEDGNNNYDAALKMYNEFDSKSELSKEKVIEAKYFLNLFKFREDYLKAKDSYERYVAACKIMTCLVGKNGFERVENDGLTNKELSSSIHMIDDKYLDNATKRKLNDFRENFIEEYENIKVEYHIYMLLSECEYLLENEIDKNKIMKSIKDTSIVFYYFDNTEFVSKYNTLIEIVNKTQSGSIDKTSSIMVRYDDLRTNANNTLYKIQAGAYELKGKEYFDNGEFDEAYVEYDSAYGKYENMGGIGEVDKERVKGQMDQIKKQLTDAKDVENRGKIGKLIDNAVELFNKGKYTEAETACEEIDKKIADAKINSGQEYEEYQELKTRVKAVIEAKEYEDQAKAYEKSKDYVNAKTFYSKAENAYKEACVSVQEFKMIEKVNEMTKKIEEEKKNQEKETE